MKDFGWFLFILTFLVKKANKADAKIYIFGFLKMCPSSIHFTQIEDLEKIGNWDFQWKMNFISNYYKQAQEIKFSRKKTVSLHPTVHIDNRPVKTTQIHKYLGMMLD